MALAWRGICQEVVLVDKNEKKGGCTRQWNISDAFKPFRQAQQLYGRVHTLIVLMQI